MTVVSNPMSFFAIEPVKLRLMRHPKRFGRQKMNLSESLDYIRWRSHLLMSGRYGDLARHYNFPTPIGLAGKSLILNSESEAELQLHRLRVTLNERGIYALDPTITAIELPRETQRIWVRWQARDAFDNPVSMSNTVYEFDVTDDFRRVVAMEHTTLLIPEFSKTSFRNRLVRSRFVH
jgi:hypothetical protein